jgi:hypothetical protein
MAIVQHSAFQSGSTHEPKHITLNSTGASGKVITNSSSVAGTSEYRRLTSADIDEVDDTFMVEEFTSTTAQTHYIPVPYNGTILDWYAVVNGALTTASNTYELRLDGVQVTGTPITFAIAGAAGDQQSATATAANTMSTGQNIEVVGTSIGNADTSIDTRFIINVRRA